MQTLNKEITMPALATVLVVDDAPEYVLNIKGILAGYYKIMVATSGAKALEIAGAALPDIILLDIVMPELDGFEVCRRLKQSESTRDIPVIFISSLNESADEEMGFALGGVDYITKPISPSIMLARVRTHIELRRTSLMQAREQVLLAQKEAFENLTVVANGIPALIAHVDARQRYLYVNSSYARWTGFAVEEILSRQISDVMPEDSYHQSAAYIEKVLSGEPCFNEQTVSINGRKRIHFVSFVPQLNDRGEVKSFFVLITDITDLRQVTEQLLHSQKMDAVGRFAGGVAHDFNNILSVITGYCQLMQLNMAADAPHSTYLDLIAEAAERATALTQTLLAICRKESVDFHPVNLNTVVFNAEKFIRRIIGEDIHVSVSLYGKPLTVLADSGQIEQIIINLAANARDAMPAGGTFTLSLEMHELDSHAAQHYGCAPGFYAKIIAADSGTGMDAETASRIFEPFFTTKESGKGTGLGLAIVYGIVTQHNGIIAVTSEPDNGTCFTLLLPLHANQPDIPVITDQNIPCAGSETLLIAEDDEATRLLLERALGSFGYRVIMVEDGREAVSRFMQLQHSIDLVILDVLMPHMNGKEAYDCIKRIQPDAGILFMSGYPREILASRGALDDTCDMFHKPIKLPGFITKIREMIDRKPDRPRGAIMD